MNLSATINRIPRSIASLSAITVLAILGTAGCRSTPTASPAPPVNPVASAHFTADANGPITAVGDGWTPAGLDGPVPAPGTCHIQTGSNGAPLPDPRCTPGAIDAGVTDPGHSDNRRPPAALTDTAKHQLMTAYGIPWTQRAHYELDHLVPVCAGGASDLRNLWPEPDTFETGGSATTYVRNSKDRVEDYLCNALRKHTTTAARAQHAIAANWTTAVDATGLPPIPANYDH